MSGDFAILIRKIKREKFREYDRKSNCSNCFTRNVKMLFLCNVHETINKIL
jgi:hypothetical protein